MRMKFADLFEISTPPTPVEAKTAANLLAELSGHDVYPQSVTRQDGVCYALGRQGTDKHLLILFRGDAAPAGFQGEGQGVTRDGVDATLLVCPMDLSNGAALRATLPYTKPRRLGLATSAGCGDRLGLATPGHIQALRGKGIAAILAQQSMRENARTGRTPEEVVNDAAWGVFQEGWREGYGADADHLKTPEHIDLCVAAGYTFFTIDPGDHVNNEAHSAPLEQVLHLVEDLPWQELESSPADMRRRYLGQTFALSEDLTIGFTEETLARAAGKYGRAIAHTVRMYRHLASRCDDFELEMSVDETETVTSPEEHFFIAAELKRLGVKWVSLAPRYVGRFEKGVDYIGDPDALAASLARHAAIARHMGPYKLSIHSGSDKFSVYPIFAEVTQGLVHLKTAGTSYLEALRAIARVRPELFRRCLEVAIAHYPRERASYHVSAELARVRDPRVIADPDLPGCLDQFDTRQVLHVGYGVVLDAFGTEIKQILQEHEEEHYAALRAHFEKHLRPFVR
ncbi:MAG: hypothetical protein D6775_09195 [Caldilineae bacterium]|nr:MAG: hypothetical protein D6775_09195 [Caldilineae bacterium]